MKGYIYIICLLLFSSLSSAVLYESWHNHGDTFTVQGIQHEVIHEFGDNKALIIIGTSSIMIKEGKCSEKGGREYCLLAVDSSLDSDNIKYSGGTVLGAVEIQVEALGPEVSVSRAIEETSLELKERYTVTVTIENTGNRGVDWFEYEDILPPQFEIGESLPSENAFRAEGSLAPGQNRILTYTVTAVSPFTHTSYGNLTYEYDGEFTNMKGNSLSLSVDSPFDIDIDLDQDEIAYGEDFEYEVVLENEDGEESLRVKVFEIYAPDFKVLSVDDNLTDDKNGKYSWSGWLEPEEKFVALMKFEGNMAGDQEIRLRVVIEEKSQVYDYADVAEITVKLSEMTPSLGVTPRTVNPNADVKLTAGIENNGDIQLTVTEAKMTAFGKTFTSGETNVQGNDDMNLFTENVKAPNEVGEYEVNLEGKYESPSGQKFDFSKRVIMKVVDTVIEEQVEEVVEETEDEVEETQGMITAPQPKKEKKGFFGKVFGGIGGFFGWLFS